MKSKTLHVVVGPTASGKTNFAIALSQKLGGAPILSADSRQIYSEMSIGTAVPDAQQLQAAPHHFIQFVSVTESYSAGDYERDANALLDKIFATSDAAILCGGTGLYIQAVLEGMDRFPEVPETVKAQVAELWQTQGLPALQDTLAKLDPVYFASVDQQNPARLRRALEVSLAAGQPYSSFLQNKENKRAFDVIGYRLNPPKEVLLKRIRNRIEQMLAAGLVAEARALRPYAHLRSMQTVGYQELFAHFDGQFDLAHAVELIEIHTRQYAKRQNTWFDKRAVGYEIINA